MNAKINSLFGIFLSLICALAQPIMAADIDIGEPFELSKRLDLDIDPAKVVFGGSSIFVIGSRGNGRGAILRLSHDLNLEARQDLNFEPQDLTMDPTEELFFLVGETKGTSVVRVLNSKLDVLGFVDLRRKLAFPSLSVTNSHQVIVGSVPTASASGAFVTVDASDPTDLREDNKFYVARAWKGMTDAWLSEDQNTIFINGAPEIGLYAVDITKERLLSDISYTNRRSSNVQQPFSVYGLTSDMTCREGLGSSFIVADNERDTLMLVDYDMRFRSLNIEAQINFTPRIDKGATSSLMAGTNIPRSDVLIASSCTQSTVLVGSHVSKDLVQFARNPNSSALEQVGKFELRDFPTGIFLSRDGKMAVVIPSTGQRIDKFVQPNADAGQSKIIGDDLVRELQRKLASLGYSVGFIDGDFGPNTLQSVTLAQKQLGFQVPDLRDAQAVLEALQKFKPKK